MQKTIMTKIHRDTNKDTSVKRDQDTKTNKNTFDNTDLRHCWSTLNYWELQNSVFTFSSWGFCHLPYPFFVLQFCGKQNPRIDMWQVHDILEHLGLGHALGKVVPDIWVTLAIPPVWARSCKQACKDSYWQRTFLWQALKLWFLEQKSY